MVVADQIPDLKFYRLRFYVELLRRSRYDEEANLLEQIIEQNENTNFIDTLHRLIMEQRIVHRLDELPPLFPIDSVDGENILLYFYFYREPLERIARTMNDDDELLIQYPFLPPNAIENLVRVNRMDLMPLSPEGRPLEVLRYVYSTIEREVQNSLELLAMSDTENSLTHVNAMRILMTYSVDPMLLPRVLSSDVAYLEITDLMHPFRSSQQYMIVFRELYTDLMKKIASRYYELPPDFDPFEYDENILEIKNYEDKIDLFNVEYVAVTFLIRVPLSIDWETFRDLYRPGLGNTLVFHTIRFDKRRNNETAGGYRELFGVV